jgi:type VI secretion system protein ImpM
VSAGVLTAPTSAEAPGYYGKLPARGDFLGRRLSRQFIRDWDTWLQQVIPASQEVLGEQWLKLYLVSPLWRFILSARACGPNSVAGVMMPSVDSVSRCFPLMVGREFPPDMDFSDFLSDSLAWYDTIEELALSALAPDFSLEIFDRPVALDLVTKSVPTAKTETAQHCRHIVVDPSTPDRLVSLIGSFPTGPSPTTFWWTYGSKHVAPCLLVCPGMPPAESFAPFLSGNWDLTGWLSEESTATAAQPKQQSSFL